MSTPTTPQTTYFGDVNVYGNTTMSGTLAVLGTPALFRSNLGVVTDGTSLIGTQAIPFQYAWMTSANTTSVNFLTNIPGPIGVATTASGATVTIQGNVQVSNSVSTTNVNVTTSINTGSVMNVNFLTGPGGVGVGTNVVGTAALAVLGTMNSVSSFQAANLILSGTLNVTSANIFSIATTNVGIGTTPVTGGAILAVQGFASVSNAITTTNVYVTTANVARLNTAALVNSSGSVGFGTDVASGTTAYVLGDLGSSNAINSPVMTSNGLIATGRINVATIVARSNVGVGIAPVQGGPALAVAGNVFLSNAFTTPQVFADFMNVSNRSNIVTGVALSNVFVGPEADQYVGFNLMVDGNVVISNALQTAGVTADLINVGSSANLLAIMSPFSLGVSNPINGAGAFFSLDSTYDDTAVVPSYTTAPTTLSGTPAFISGAGPAGQDVLNLPIASLRWDSTSVVPASKGFTIAGWVYFNSAFSAGTTPLFEVYTPAGGGDYWYAGVCIKRSGALYYWSTQFLLRGKGTDTINTTTQPVTGQWYHVALTLSTARVMTLYVNGSLRGSTSIASAGSWPPSGETNPQNFYLGDAPDVGGPQISTRYSGIGLYPTTLSQGQISALYLSGTFALPATSQYGISGNFYASNTLTIFTANTFTANTARSTNIVSITARTSVGIRTAADATGSTALRVQGNAFVSNALTATKVFATTSANTTTLNTESIFTTSSGFLGISTSAPSGTSLYVLGNVFITNSFTTSQISVTNSNILASNLVTLTAQANVGIGTVAPVSTFWTPTAGLTPSLPVGASGAYVAAYSLRALNGTTALTANVVSPLAEFPPYAMTSATTSLAGYSFGGAGSYTATASSEFQASQAAYFAFDKTPGSGTTNYWASVAGSYDVPTGTCISGASLGGYTGEWLKIQFPSQIIPLYFSLQARTDVSPTQMPAGFYMIGSTDNSTWNLVTSQTGIAWSVGQTQTFAGFGTTPFNYYALVIRNIPSGSAYNTCIGEWRIYGTTFQDFYSTPAGLLTTAAGSGTTITAWGGSNTTPGNVLTWYDQSGVGNHVTQTTAALQPIITQTTYGPGYMIQFNGTAQYLQDDAFSYNFNTGSYNYTISTQISNNTGGCVAYKGVAGLLWTSAGAKKWWLGANSTNEGLSGNFPNIVGNSEGYVLANTPIPSGGAPAVVTWSSAAFSSVTLYENGASVPVTYSRASAQADPGTVFAIGAGGSSAYYNGNMFELLVFSTNLEAYPPAATTIYQNEFSYLSPVGILGVQGNAFISNAVTTTNVYATTSANVLTLNTGSIFTTGTGFLGVGTSAPSGTTLYVSGNVYTSNALATTNVRATTMNVTGRANTTNFRMATGQFLGVGTTPTGNALEVSGNAFVSNAIRSTNVFSTLANLGTLNTLSIFTQNSFLGIGTSAASGTSLFVPGNVYASTSTNTPTAFTSSANVALRGNAATFTSGTGIVVPTRFVAVATQSASAAYSNDGITWIASTMPSVSSFEAVTVNPTTGRFVAVAQATTAAAYSNDGITWVASTMPSAAVWQAVTVNPTTGRFVAVAQATTAAAYSNDGITWVVATLPSAVNWQSVTVNPTTGRFVAVAQATTAAAYSNDGITWVASTMPSSVNWQSVTVNPTTGRFVAVAQSSTAVAYSNDGITWVASTMPSPVNWQSVTVNPTTGRFVAVQSASTAAAYSNDGITWVASTMPSSVSWQSVTVNPTTGRFVAVSGSTSSTTAAYSDDGINWVVATLPASRGWHSVTAYYSVGSPSLSLLGNLYASNAVTTTNITATTANVTRFANVTNLAQISAISLGVSAGGAKLNVQGNVVASNSVTTTNVFTTSVNTATANTLSISAPVGVGLTGYSGPWGYVPFNGTLVDSIGNLTNPVITGTLTYTTTNGPGGGPTLVAAPSSYPLWTMSSLINVDNGLTVSLWVKFNAAYSATRDIFSGATFYNQGLNFAISGSKFQLNFWTKPVPVRSIINTTITPVVGTWYNLACTINNSKTITFYVNGGSVGSATYTNSGTTMGPSIWLNGPTLVSTGEAEYTDLQIYTADLTDGEISSIYNLNAARPLTGYAIRVRGNLYASNALTIGGNIAATSMNLVSTLNTGSITSAILLVDELGWSNTNIFISNSITTTNVFTTNVNAASYVGTSGSIGINTAGSGYALQINGNLALSNTLSSLPDVSALTSIYYVDDITKRSPHLLPTQSNAGLIQNWISTTCNAASQPTEAWWSTSPTPVFGNAATGPPGGGAYQGSVLLPDGRVLFVPYNSSKIGMFNPTTNEYSEIIPNGLTLNAGGAKYSGGVLLPNGNVIFGPQTSNIGTFNPLSLQFSNTSVAGIATNFQVFILNEPTGNVMISHNSGISSYDPRTGGIYLASGLTQGSASTLTPTGNILQIYTSGIRYYDPYAGVATNRSIASEAYRASSLTLTVDGNVVSIPNTFNAGAGNIRVIKPSDGTRTSIFNTTVTELFAGGILLPTGNIVCVPYNSSDVLMIDPIALTTSNAATVGGSGLGLYGGGTLLPDGRVVFAPYNSMNVGVLSTFTPAPVEFCLSPYFNKL